MNGLEPLIFCIKQFRLKNGIIKQTPISFPQLNLFLVGKRGNDVDDGLEIIGVIILVQ